MFLTAVTVVLLAGLDRLHSLSCFKCMTSDFQQDLCKDPFNPVDNRLEHECQATIRGRSGLFPARFCVKISGVVVDVDRGVNQSLLHNSLFLRTCITENIMDSTRSLDSTGHFRLKNFGGIDGEIKMQGTITLCTIDGCNPASFLVQIDVWTVACFCLLLMLHRING